MSCLFYYADPLKEVLKLCRVEGVRDSASYRIECQSLPRFLEEVLELAKVVKFHTRRE